MEWLSITERAQIGLSRAHERDRYFIEYMQELQSRAWEAARQYHPYYGNQQWYSGGWGSTQTRGTSAHMSAPVFRIFPEAEQEVREPLENTLYTEQADKIAFFREALLEHAWKEAFHLLVATGFTSENNDHKSLLESRFCERESEMRAALKRELLLNPEAKYVRQMMQQLRADKTEQPKGLGVACTSDSQRDLLAEFLQSI